MTGGEALHQIVGELPDQDVPTARRVLEDQLEEEALRRLVGY